MDLYPYLLDLAATLRATPDADRAPYAAALRDEYLLYGLADRVETDPNAAALAEYLEATAASMRGLTPAEVAAINAAHAARN